MRIKTKLVLLIFMVLFFAPQAWACDACQKSFENQLLSGEGETAHAKELLGLMKKAKAAPPAYATNTANTLPQSDDAFPLLKKSSPQTPPPPALKESDIAQRKKAKGQSLPPTSYVKPGTKPDKKFTISMSEGETFLGNGVMYNGFLIDGKVPGPTFIAEEGDVIEFTVVNKGDVPHGVSLHAAYTQTSKHLGKIMPGETKSMLFRASYPGVYMYHCAPGGHAIPMHVLLGQYGMMVVKPKTHKYRMEEVLGKKPDVELYLLQHEIYASGKDAIEGHPKYQLFNGKMFRYVEEPVVAKPGDFIRIHFLNVGPNLLSTFHIVGIVWDFAYWQGLPNPENTFVAGQSVLAGPTDSWIVDFRAPEDEGAYLMLNHAVGMTSRGAIGILSVSNDGARTKEVLADGPEYTNEEMLAFKEKAVRTISPSAPSPEELANPWKLPAGQKSTQVEIIGNSYHPKVIEIPVGTTVEWINEDAFTYFDGEFAGIHNVVTLSGPEIFASPMLGHAERFSHTFTKAGEYNYMCTPHPYMRGVVRVVENKK